MKRNQKDFTIYTLPQGTRLHTITSFNDGTKGAQRYFESEFSEHPELWKHLKPGESNSNFTDTSTFYLTRVHPFCKDLDTCPYMKLAQTRLKRNVRLLFMNAKDSDIDVWSFNRDLRKISPRDFDGTITLDHEPLQCTIMLFRPFECLKNTYSYALSKDKDGYDPKHKEEELEYLSSAIKTIEFGKVTFDVTRDWISHYSNIQFEIREIMNHDQVLSSMKEENVGLFQTVIV